MKAEFLKLAGVKSEKAFYKKYPTEAAFFKAHPEAKDSVKKAQWGVATSMVGNYVQGMNNVPNINNVIQGQMQSPGVNSGMYSSAPNYDQMYRSMSTDDEQLKQPQGQQPSNANAMMQGGMNIFTGLLGGAQTMRQQKKDLKDARMWANVTDVVKRAAISNQFAEKPKNTWIRPDDENQIFNINQMYPGQGVGTNALARNGARLQDGGMIEGNPTEIQNTYGNGNSLFDDLGYEPLIDENQQKSFYHGGNIPRAQFGIASAGMEGFGQNSFSSLTGSMFNNSGGSQMGSAVGSIFGPFGGLAGGMIGGMFDKTPGKIKDAQQRTQRNMDYVTGIDNTQYTHNYLGNMGVAKDGGWVSNDWQPQVIAKFGEYDVEDLFEPTHDADMLRAGGHLKSYREPSARAMQTFDMGGELKTHWGGYAEPMSENPYLPGTGETVMFRGKSHEEYSPNGETGIGITYGDNPVEVERGEPAVKLKDGSSGEESLVVYGNLEIPKYGIDLLGDKNAKGKKFKNYVADLSKTEVKQNKLIDKSTDELDRLDVKNSFDKLKLSSLEANIKGGNMKLKSIADKKVKAADLQSAINDTAEEYGLVADDLAKGKVKIDKEAMKAQAKYGTTIDKFQGGGKLKSVSAMKEVPKGQKRNEQTGLYGNVTPEMFEKMKERNSWYDWENFDPSDEKDVYDFQGKFNKLAQAFGEKGIQYDGDFGEQTASADSSWFKSRKRGEALATPAIKSTSTTDDNEDDATFETSPYKRSGLMDALGQILPYIRPTDQEPLDPRQLAPEMIAKVQNRLEPVNMQTYNPKLNDLYDISYQDVLNENDSDFLTALRNNNNPQFKANLLAQKYAANSKVLGEQFRANQAMRDRVFSGNTATLNDAQKTNLGLADQQFVRQQQALTNTRDKDLEIAKSYADKYAKHALENRTLGVYENLYNYRYDKSGRAINMNAPFQPNIPYIYGADGKPTHKIIKDANGKIIGYQPIAKEQAAVIPSQATPPFVEQPAYISEDYAPIDEEEYTNEEYMDQVAPKKFGGKVKKKYSQSSIVRAFK